MNENEKKELLELSEEMTSCIPQIDAEDKSKVLTMGARRIRELLAENECLKHALQAANEQAGVNRMAATSAEAKVELLTGKLLALCESEPVAWEVVSNANGYTELRRTYPDRGDGVFREDVELQALIPRPSMEKN